MPLFENTPDKTNSVIISENQPLTKDQTNFNALIKKIELRKKSLAEWLEAMSRLREKIAAEIYPLQDQHLDLTWELAQCLDSFYEKKGITKTEKRKISGI